MPDPFNTVTDLLTFTSFQQGPGNGQASVAEGTFTLSQFESALQRARNEIYARAGKMENAAYETWRYDQLTEAELWLATARLYPMFGERLTLKFPESNMSALADVTIGADTPSPVEKGVHYVKFMTQRIRAFGLELLYNHSENWDMRVGTEPSVESDPYPCLANGVYTTSDHSCCSYL